ncbi:ornithine carbamoyltransferase [bacterium]|nr:MAG: ornithine carbamoyltransferase [bacterium]
MKQSLRGKHLITFDDWSKEEIESVLKTSAELKSKRAAGEITNLLVNKTLFMIFFEQSTRTRNSLEAAMTQLGGHAHDLTAGKMQISHGETPRDTAEVLSRMGEAIAIRNCFYGIGNEYLRKIAEYSSIPLISMQDDIYHPLQAIADLMTIREHFGGNTNGLKVAISWAYATSHAKPLSVPQSQILLFPRFGIEVVVAHPHEFPLQKAVIEKAEKNATNNGGSLSFVSDMDEAIDGADIIIPKNWGGFAFFDDFADDDRHLCAMKDHLDRHKDWILDDDRYASSGGSAKIMHALPADRGKEVSDSVLDGENSIIYDEAENRLHTAKGLLSLLMGS